MMCSLFLFYQLILLPRRGTYRNSRDVIIIVVAVSIKWDGILALSLYIYVLHMLVGILIKEQTLQSLTWMEKNMEKIHLPL